MTLEQIYRGKRVLLTGHTGFKGAWLTLWLRMLGAQVCGYALGPPSIPNLFDVARLADCIDDHRGDITDTIQLNNVVRTFEPEIVFHLAAQSVVRRGFAEPIDTFTTNVIGTASLLDACRGVSSVRAVVCVTSDKCYDNREWHWGYREIDRLGGHDPYSNSKACAELVADCFRRSYFNVGASPVGLATARAGNVIGGGDWAQDRLVPDLVRSVSSGIPASIRYPHAVRPWQHVLEPLAGYLRLGERLAQDPQRYGEAWNFGPRGDSLREVGEVVRHFEGQWSPRLQVVLDSGPRLHEAGRLALDSSKASVRLEWHQRLGIEQSLGLTSAWYERYWASPDVMRGFTESQIDAYMKMDAGVSKREVQMGQPV